MRKFLEKALWEFPEEIKLVAVTPAANNLFTIKEAEVLNEEDIKISME